MMLVAVVFSFVVAYIAIARSQRLHRGEHRH